MQEYVEKRHNYFINKMIFILIHKHNKYAGNVYLTVFGELYCLKKIHIITYEMINKSNTDFTIKRQIDFKYRGKIYD